MDKYVVLEKQVGETPLVCAEIWRDAHPEYEGVPLAYAGRLDPMASGKLLILIGEECKKQSEYHGLDKTYEFEILFGIQSDSGDVLGIVSGCTAPHLDETALSQVANELTGEVTFPYPKFSSKTVKGKPLHTWTLEGKLNEIEIPFYTTTIYKLKLQSVRRVTAPTVFAEAARKIESIPPVTDEHKAIGNDFRRPDVRAAWKKLEADHDGSDFTVARFTCTCSSGTYMRTLAEEIAKRLGTCGLAYAIHRTKIGAYKPLPFGLGMWTKKY